MDKTTRITEAQISMSCYCFNELKAEKWDAGEDLNGRGFKKEGIPEHFCFRDLTHV